MNNRGIHIIKVLFISCCLIISTAQLNLAQESQFRFEHFQLPGGDQTSFVTDIVQDSLGFMWFGTWNGLYRYDGYSFTNFTHNPSDSTSIGTNWVETLYVDKNGTLWVGTYGGGLNRFNSEKETFSNFQNNAGNPVSLSQDSVTVIFEDHVGALWVGTMDGLNRFNRDTETFSHFYYDPDDPTSLIDNHVRAIYEDTRGTFWVGTAGDGLHRMNRNTGTFTRHRTDFEIPDKLSRPFSSTSEFDESDPIQFIMEDHNKAIWMGSAGNIGINRFDPDTEDLARLDPSLWRGVLPWKMFQSRDGTLWLATLGDGVWKVHYRMNRFEDLLLDNLSWGATLHYDRSGILWVSSADENFQMKFNGFTNVEDAYTLSRSIETGIIGTGSAFAQTRDGTYWVGFYEESPLSRVGGLYRKSSDTDALTNALPNDAGQVGPVTLIYESDAGQLWFGTKWTGVFGLNQQDGNLNNYSFTQDSSNSLAHTNVTALYESSLEPNILWIGTEGGLNRLDRRTETITAYLHDPVSRYITSIDEDTSGTLWIATLGDGLFAYNREADSFTQFTIFNSGLPDSHVLCLLGDDNGFLWISIGDDITRFNPVDRSFYTFSGENAPNVGTFGSGTCDENREGVFAFGGIRGLTTFHPNRIFSDETPPEIVFTAFILDDQYDNTDPESLLHQSTWQAEKINLQHYQNTFSVEFAALDYRNPESNHYMYQLEGYDAFWLDGGTQRRASYKQVPHGEYILNVRAANSAGIWNEKGASIRITILPPWWQTWWAYGFYALLFAAGIFCVDRFQRSRLINKERERARERELEQQKAHGRQMEQAYSELEDSLNKLTAAQDQLVQQEKLASLGQLTAGIAHEIKNPLNFVNNFSEVSTELIQEAQDEIESVRAYQNKPLPEGALNEMSVILDDIEANLRKIHEHGTSADSIVKSMLQHSRGGSGKMEPTDLNTLIKEYANLAFHGMRAGKDPIEVDIELDLNNDIGDVPLVAEDFSRVILNICNNAFDAMREKLTADSSQSSADSPFEGGSERSEQGDGSSGEYEPKLTIRTHKKDTSVTIEIQDNGPGIPEEIKDKILQPFFTTKKGTQGTGLGLSITHDIVKAHGGELKVASQVGEGTTFVIELPKMN